MTAPTVTLFQSIMSGMNAACQKKENPAGPGLNGRLRI
jgi:hypothetical protein